MTAVPRFRAHKGWPLLANGFRPFFLFGSIYAGLAILVWLPVFHGELTLISVFAPRDWHVHEMLYGYLPAVITGFLFTAIPNWTGRLPIQGTPLLVLVIVWVSLAAALWSGPVYFHSKARFLVPVFPLLLPLAVPLARQRLRMLVTVLGAGAVVSAWYGGYLLTVWTRSP